MQKLVRALDLDIQFEARILAKTKSERMKTESERCTLWPRLTPILKRRFPAFGGVCNRFRHPNQSIM